MTVLWDTIGISIQLVSTFLAALAYVLQKKAHIRVSAGGIESWSDPANRKALVLWRGGFALMVVCALLDLSTYPMLDLSKQAPLGAATLVFNSILASILLAEPFTVLDLLSTVLIFAGTITAVINSEAESATFTFPEIIGLLDDGIVKAYSAVVIPGLLGAAFFIERVSRTNPGDWSPSQRRAMALLSPASGGMFMGFTGYTAKCLSTVVAGQEWDQFKNPLLYLFTLLAAISVTGQLRYLNKGLAFFDALQVVPIFQCFIIFSNALAGIVYFHDMRSAPAYKLAMFAIGGGVCIAGIALLLFKKSSHGDAHAAKVVVAAATEDGGLIPSHVFGGPAPAGAGAPPDFSGLPGSAGGHEGTPVKQGSMAGLELPPGAHGYGGPGGSGSFGGAGAFAPYTPSPPSALANPAEVDLMGALQQRIWAAQSRAKAAVFGYRDVPASAGGAGESGAHGGGSSLASPGGGAGAGPGGGGEAGSPTSHGSGGPQQPRRMTSGSFSAGSVNGGGIGSHPSLRRLPSRSRAGSISASVLAAFSHAAGMSDVIAAASAAHTVAAAAGHTPQGLLHSHTLSQGHHSHSLSHSHSQTLPLHGGQLLEAATPGASPPPVAVAVGAGGTPGPAGAPGAIGTGGSLRQRGRSRVGTSGSLPPVDEEAAGGLDTALRGEGPRGPPSLPTGARAVSGGLDGATGAAAGSEASGVGSAMPVGSSPRLGGSRGSIASAAVSGISAAMAGIAGKVAAPGGGGAEADTHSLLGRRPSRRYGTAEGANGDSGSSSSGGLSASGAGRDGGFSPTGGATGNGVAVSGGSSGSPNPYGAPGLLLRDGPLGASSRSVGGVGEGASAMPLGSAGGVGAGSAGAAAAAGGVGVDGAAGVGGSAGGAYVGGYPGYQNSDGGRRHGGGGTDITSPLRGGPGSPTAGLVPGARGLHGGSGAGGSGAAAGQFGGPSSGSFSSAANGVGGSEAALDSARQQQRPPPQQHALAWHEHEVKDLAAAAWRRYGPLLSGLFSARRGSYTEFGDEPSAAAGARRVGGSGAASSAAAR